MSDHPFQRVAFEPIGRDDLNACLSAWKHRMGELRRPTRGWDHGLRYGNELVAVIATDTLIRPRVAGFDRHQAIELSRLCAVRPDICRVALRLWRLFVFPAIAQERGCSWALSYQDAVLHSGDLYRFDGWVRLGVSRSGVDPRTGRRGRSKVIWGWCDDPDVRRRGRPLPSEEGSTLDGQGASGRVIPGMTLQ